jgi:Putative transposase DNA-binding domain/Probable transposase
MNESPAEGSAPLRGSARGHQGSTPRPEGERAARHGGKTAEASPEALANRTLRGASTTPSQEGSLRARSDGADPPAGDSATRERSSVELDSFEIVRATTRFQVDFRRLSLEENKGRKPSERRIISAVERQAREILDDVSRMATTARNVAMRALVRADTDALDKVLAETGEMPRDTTLWMHKCYSYPLIRASCPRLSSHIAATLQKAVDDKWKKVRRDVLIRQTESAPHFRTGQPFPVPTQAMRFETHEGVDAQGKPVLDATVSCTLYSQEQENGIRRVLIPLVSRDAHQEALLRNLSSGAWKVGQATLERDRLTPSKWYLRLAYKRVVPRRQGSLSAAINKGIKTFLVAVTEGGETWRYDGFDIEAYLKQIQRRRREYQYDSKASNRWGHGRARTLRPTKPLEDKAGRWRETRCQVIARRLAKWLSAAGVTTLYIEDFTGIRDGVREKLEGGTEVWNRIQEWPYFKLQTRLIACCQEEGIQSVIVGAHYISQRCPACGHVDVKNRDLRHWLLRCEACRFKRHLDVAAAMNVLARGKVLTDGGDKEIKGLPMEPPVGKDTARRARTKPSKPRAPGESGRKG